MIAGTTSAGIPVVASAGAPPEQATLIVAAAQDLENKIRTRGFLPVGHVDDVRYFETPTVLTDGSEDKGDDEIDLDHLDALARASWDYPWEVSRSNGTITAIQPGNHRVTVAFAANVDEEYSCIKMREEEAVYLETFSPPVVRRLIAMARRGGR